MVIKNANLSLYNSKYLKYKNKYLSLKKMFGGTKKVNVIAVLPNREERVISFSDDEELINAVARELGVRHTQIMVSYTDSVVSMGLTAEDCGIDNYSRLTITFLSETIKTKRQFRDIVARDILYLNNHLTIDTIMGGVTTLNDGEDEDIVDITLNRLGINILPESFGYIIVTGNLNLSNNQLQTLPDSFGNINVHGKMKLSHNPFAILPESFKNITLGGNLYISMNQLRTCGKTFQNIKIGGEVRLL